MNKFAMNKIAFHLTHNLPNGHREKTQRQSVIGHNKASAATVKARVTSLSSEWRKLNIKYIISIRFEYFAIKEMFSTSTLLAVVPVLQRDYKIGVNHLFTCIYFEGSFVSIKTYFKIYLHVLQCPYN